MAATRTIGQMQEFYQVSLPTWRGFNAIADDKLVPTLLTIVESRHYSFIRGLISPALPKDKTYDQLVEFLQKHYDPVPIVIVERFHFYQRNQHTRESITDYLTSLRRLACHARFGPPKSGPPGQNLSKNMDP